MNTNPVSNTEQPEPKSWREERRERREARRAALGNPSKAGGLVIGLLLVILGAVVLLQNTGTVAFSLRNWGALFILIPIIAAFERSYRYYRNAGNRLTAPSRGAILVGIILLVVMFIILLNLNWTIWGPVLIISVGAILLINMLLRG